ncbi:cation:proton antiporter [Sphingomonas oligoaromativorans]|jgi:CPA1 family monovalent cation:H+ antiporter|uniref:cation:proton antiporter n=1 Tax=Sphingomonas oligoaromativorans TaxID=575322 RepID=UPI001423351C|nr:cation:proton antiporter [Sphingomonas oligoaromativorans]NIJ33327.1 CPA1 family monovalent cation:H+ antiporter [Sphingomonas oligoaromativorans]
MTFFESLLVLLLAAIVLLQISRRLSLPYPSMLALAGVIVALVPGAPHLPIDPETALALFIAPALMDSAFDFPIGTARRFWAPLLAYAVGGVVVTTALVAWAGWAVAGLPLAAAIVLGAIVAPPDAAAATAVLSSMAIPRRTDTVLRGESLFNDAAALLLFGTALSAQTSGGLSTETLLHLAIAVPGGVLFGMAVAWVFARLSRFVAGTLGGVLLQFVSTFLTWIAASHLGLSPVLSIVALAMGLARSSGGPASARMRVSSYAIWGAVVFVLNVMAFLLMGMQAQAIMANLSGAELHRALGFTALVVMIVLVARAIVAVGFNRSYAWYLRRRGEPQRASLREALLASWCGMRGLVTLATAFALPAAFPQRSLVVLAAFGVVIATLVVQGLTLGPVIRLLGLNLKPHGPDGFAAVQRQLVGAALASLDDAEAEEAAPLRAIYGFTNEAIVTSGDGRRLARFRELALAAVATQRATLEQARAENRINIDEYNWLLEDIDWWEIVVLPDDKRRIEET